MDMTEVTQKTPAEIRKETARANRVAAMARARAARKPKVIEVTESPALSKGDRYSEGDIKFFSETDLRMDSNGNITGRNCDYPRWYFPKMIQDAKEEIRSKKFSIDSGKYPQGRIAEAKDSLREAEKRLAQMEEKQPDFSRYTDTLAEIADGLGKRLSDTMSTISQQKKGLGDPHRDVLIDTTPSIDISSLPKAARLAEANGFRITKGKLTGSDALRLWQLSRTAIGESGNSEWLRKD